MNWNGPTIRRLREAVERGETSKQIAAAFGTTVDAVAQARSKHKIRQPAHVKRVARWRSIGTADLLAAVERGESDTQIAERVGITRGAVRQARYRAQIKARPPVPSKIDHAVLRDLIDRGYNDAQCARHFGVSAQLVGEHRRALGILRAGVAHGWQGAPPIPDAKANLIRAAAAHGWSRKKLMTHFQLGPARLTRILATP